MQFENFVDDSDKILISFGILCKKYEYICEELGMTKLVDGKSPNELYEELMHDISINNTKVNREEMICVVYGRVSSGKSTLINAMLSRSILPCDIGQTTNSYVKIMQSKEKKDYIIFPDSELKMDISDINRVDITEDSLKPGSNVQVFLVGINKEVLQENVAIIDTPGISTDAVMDQLNYDMCAKADLLILVVNSEQDISEDDKNFLLKFKMIGSKFKLLIVFNKWDTINDSKKDFFKVKNTKDAENYLQNELRVINNQIDEGIFFLSAAERLNIINEDKSTTMGWIERDRSFDCFLTLFKQYCSESIQERKMYVMENNFKMIMKAYNSIKDHITDNKERSTKKVGNILSKLINMNEIINESIENLFDNNYEKLIECGLNSLKINESELENSATIMNTFITEQMVVLVESLKIIINEKISPLADDEKEFLLKVFEKFYFPNIINIDIVINIIENCDLFPVFNEIAKPLLIDSYEHFSKIISEQFSTTISIDELGFENLKNEIDKYNDKWENEFVRMNE